MPGTRPAIECLVHACCLYPIGPHLWSKIHVHCSKSDVVQVGYLYVLDPGRLHQLMCYVGLSGIGESEVA